MKIPNLKAEIEQDEIDVQRAEELKEQQRLEKEERFNERIKSYADYIRNSKFMRPIYEHIKDNVYYSFTNSIKIGFFSHTRYDHLTQLGEASPRVRDELHFSCSITELEMIDKVSRNFNCVVGHLYDVAFKELLQENDIENKDIDVTWDSGLNEFYVDRHQYLIIRAKVEIHYELKRINIACTLDKEMELYEKFLGTTDRMEIEDIHLKARANKNRQDKLND